MKIEHFALQVEDPQAVARWYCEHLGFEVRKKLASSPFTHFLADAGGRSMIEIYHNESYPVPDYRSMSPTTLHLAFVCPDIRKTVEGLQAAGAILVSEGPVGDDQLAMLRDPWGLSIQLCRRGKPLLPG